MPDCYHYIMHLHQVGNLLCINRNGFFWDIKHQNERQRPLKKETKQTFTLA